MTASLAWRRGQWQARALAAYRGLLAAEGFDVLAFMPEDPGCGGHSVWLARQRLG